MDQTALFQLSYGLYVVGTGYQGKMNAQIANTVFQINANPDTVAISLNNNNYTKELVEKSGVFSVNVLSQQADMDIVANFGFKSGRDFDKFEKYPATVGETGSPVLDIPEIAATLECKVLQSFPIGTHTLFVGEPVAAQNYKRDVMTYADYHKMKNQSVKPAPVSTATSYKCMVCGYVETGEMGPDYKCPICGVGPEQFVKMEAKAPAPVKIEGKGYRCKVCGYIEYGEMGEDYQCPVCGVGPDQFEPLAAEPAAKTEAKPKGYRCKVCGYIEYGEMGPDYQCPVCGVGPDQFEPIYE